MQTLRSRFDAIGLAFARLTQREQVVVVGGAAASILFLLLIVGFMMSNAIAAGYVTAEHSSAPRRTDSGSSPDTEARTPSFAAALHTSSAPSLPRAR